VRRRRASEAAVSSVGELTRMIRLDMVPANAARVSP